MKLQRSMRNDLSDHPIARDQAILPTIPMEEFVNVVIDWLDSRLTGGVVWGNQRMGKTQAIRYLLDHGTQVLGAPIPTGLFSVWDPTYTSLTENRFFGALLSALNYAAPLTGTAAIKRQRLLDLIAERVVSAKEYRFLLFIDEAQWLDNVQLRYLMDLHNQLKISDIRLVCILVGQPELVEFRASLRSSKQAHLLGRFMSASHQFKGVTTEQEFKRIAYAFGEQSEYPAGSGISYTQAYVPIAYQNGWRLETNIPTIWKLLDNCLEAERLPKCNEFPMQALMALLVWLLSQLSLEDNESLHLRPELIEEGIYRRALIQIQDQISLQVSD